ncbi:MAG: tetratricopeptide repeat protein [Acidobacteria bacterium]|nr:tetratricopeptide repeat protein [Acidobacteriota bacterium]
MRNTLSIIFASAALLAQGPQPKSQKELDAINLMFQAADNDARIKAANELITKFADTQFKPLALYMLTTAYYDKKDFTNTVIQGERCVDADGKSAFGAHCRVMIATSLVSTTKEFDFDKEEKLGKVDKLAKEAIEVAKAAPKFNPNLTDEQWDQAKKGYIGEAFVALGMAGQVRKNWNAAIDAYKSAAENDPGNSPTFVRLGIAQASAGKLDDAIATFDKLLAMPNLDAAVASIGKAEKEKAVKAKGAK